MAIKSANKPAIRAYLVFFIPTDEKYIPRIQIVVSVLPSKTEATLPIKLSGPFVFRMLSNTISDDDDDIGLNIASGNNWLG